MVVAESLPRGFTAPPRAEVSSPRQSTLIQMNKASHKIRPSKVWHGSYVLFVGISLALCSLNVTPSDSLNTVRKAGLWALHGGLSGAFAGVIQVLSFMWLRTILNYQYRHGTSFLATLRLLFKQGGIRRLYRGFGMAIIHAPLTRFGDTAANAAVPVILHGFGKNYTSPLVTQAVTSMVACLWRVIITPIDMIKTVMQVEGSAALDILNTKIKKEGTLALWDGATAGIAAAFLGHFLWFLTFNFLNDSLPESKYWRARRAFIGVCAAGVANMLSNFLRVIKTLRQTSVKSGSYSEDARQLISQVGLFGFILRGVETRMLVNCVQGAVFAVVWKYFESTLAFLFE